MVKISLVFFLSFLVISSLAQTPNTKRASKPNIVIIYADDLGFGDLSCYGMKRIATPNIDRLAKDGLKFMDAHATSSTCTPSRYALITGRYPWRQNGTGVAPGDASLIIPMDKGTIASTLHQAGYETAVIGKWHLGLGGKEGIDWNEQIKPGPNEIGFDYSFIMPATLDRVPCVYVENGRVVNLDPKDPITVNYKHKVGNDPTGKENPEMLKLKPDPNQGHNQTIVDSISRIGWMSGGHSAYWRDEDIAATITDKTIQFIERNAQQPFFVYFASGDIHVPRYPNSMFRGKSGMGLRGDAILELDYSVGRLIKALDSLKLTDNTLVIFSSDNGPVLNDGYLDQAVELVGDHKPAGPLRGGKYSIFEGGTRIPFIVKWPGHVKPSTVTHASISQVDLFASLNRLVGQKLKEEDAPDSYDLLSALLGRDPKGRDYIIEQSSGLAIMKGQWKYIVPNKKTSYDPFTQTETGNLPQPQLYDLKNDLGEKNNLVEKKPAIAKELSAILDKSKGFEKTRN
ncbi:MAG: arylsulfatase [Bacteroidetes bacterium]|nr:arylsulfatase [Bacteroidota bacterium]